MPAISVYRSFRAPQYPVPIYYEDNHLLVAEKLPGLLSQEDHTGRPDILSLLKAYLVEKYHKPGRAWLGLLHRLDQPVGGLMVFAKTSKAASRMADLFRRQEVEKGYRAVVRGQLSEKQGSFTDHISKEKKQGRYYVDPQGLPASLSYRVLAYHPEVDLSLVEINLKSGRHHQIRVQFQARRHPLLGDRRYGGSEEGDLAYRGPALLAWSLAFIHPVKKVAVRVTLDEPKDYPWSLFA